VKYRIRIHIAQVDDENKEKDLGAWPEHVADVRHMQDALDLCSLVSEQVSSFLFPKERAS
jgi:hypothetical protein